MSRTTCADSRPRGSNAFPSPPSAPSGRGWAVVGFAADLVRWFQLLCLTCPLALAEPKALRWALWHTPARLVRRARRAVVRILDAWPGAAALLEAYDRISLVT